MKNNVGWLQQLLSYGNEFVDWLRQHMGVAVFGLLLLVLLVFVLLTGQDEEPPLGTPSPDNNQAVSIEMVITTTPEAISTTEPTSSNEKPSPSPTPIPTEMVDYGIIWSTSFESGSLKDYSAAFGEFIYQSNYASYKIVNYPVLNGKHATALTIDTQSLSNGKAAGAYLFYYDNPDAAWYSAWLLIPEDTQPLSWWNIWQWKSTSNRNSDQSVPMWILSLAAIPNRDDLQMGLVYRPDNIALRQAYHHPAGTVNKGEWVHISTYYQKSMDSDGIVAVFINGEEVYRVVNVQTTESDNSLYWSINHYAEGILPHPSTIYVDDVIISRDRIDPFFRLP